MNKTLYVSLAMIVGFGCSKSDEQKASKEQPKVAEPEVKPEAEVKPETEVKPEAKPDTGDYALVASDDLEYAPLDPSKPDGPAMAVVHGNPDEGPSAVFLRLPPKMDAGIHTHTAGYHALVISGKPKHWLPGEKKAEALAPGSYWWQPGGQPHGDMCEGPDPCVLFVAMDGKWDFAPAPDAKKVAPGDYALVKAADAKFGPINPEEPDGLKIAPLRGDPKAGPFVYRIEFPPGAEAGVHSHTSDYHAVVLGGTPSHWVDGADGENDALTAGTYWFQPGGQMHGDTCRGDEPCRAFVIMPKGMDFTPKG